MSKSVSYSGDEQPLHVGRAIHESKSTTEPLPEVEGRPTLDRSPMKDLRFRTGIYISRKLYHGLRYLKFVFGRRKLHRIHGANAQRKKGQQRSKGQHAHLTHQKQPFLSFSSPPLIPVTLPSLMEFRIGTCFFNDSSCARWMSYCPVFFAA